jgi:Lon protease-like protein
MTTLRLFPLNTVLFPGMPLTLQVFEERYRLLISECLAQQEPFGVVLIREGPEVGGTPVPHDIGTTTRIEHVQPVDGVRLAVQARGERRFRIVRLHHDRAYLAADVEYPVDEVAEAPDSLRGRAEEGYVQLQRLRHTIEGSWEREIKPPATVGALGDAIGALANGLVPAAEIQPLLDTLDQRRRLERAVDLLAPLVEAMHRQAQAVVAQRWGGIERRN